MARSAQKIGSLLEEEPELANALAVIVEESDGGEREVQWADVNDDLTSGQWGRLIEQGVLVDGEYGFELADADATTEALEEHGVSVDTADTGEVETSDDDEDEEASWTTWDKAAGVGSLALMFGYWTNEVRNMIGGTIDLVLGPLDQMLPFYAVIMILAVLTGTWSTILQANLIDTDKMSEYQEQMKEIQDRRKAAKERGDDEALEQIQKEQMEAMGDQLGMFKLQIRPMVWVMLLTIPAFLWMYWKILPQGSGEIIDPQQIVMPLVGALEAPEGRSIWQANVVGPVPAWLFWYFLCSMAFGQIIRKALNLQISPTS